MFFNVRALPFRAGRFAQKANYKEAERFMQWERGKTW